MRNKAAYIGLAVLTVIFVIAVSFIGCPGPEKRIFDQIARKLDEQPQISVYFHESKTKKTMPIEEYLLGVVAGEMEKGWPLEAYAAQAIVARTFTMDFISQGGTREQHNTDISTDEVEAQAYNAEAITSTIRRAVRMTEGKVLTYRNRYTKGWFSASCGGRTALARDGLGYKEKEPPYMSSVSCPEEKVIPREELYWQATLTSTEISEALKKLGKSIGRVERVEVGARSKQSHRATKLNFVGTEGRTSVLGADFRVALDPQKVRSIWITDINNKEGEIELEGRGYGHGVGLCQWGAHALAKEGKSPEEIVKHYYPKAEFKDLW